MPHACHLKKRPLPGQVPGVGMLENESLLIDLNRIRWPGSSFEAQPQKKWKDQAGKAEPFPTVRPQSRVIAIQ
jgi:hypothetical protein